MKALAVYSTLFVLGQVASLQLIRCGNAIGYQHYRPLDRPEWLIVLAIQAIAVLARARALELG